MKILADISFGALRFFLGLIARLPFGVLYALSTATAFLLEHIIRYRRKVALDNIATCYPDKSRKEHLQILHDFYCNFADYVFETIKLLHISDEDMSRRMTFSGIETIDGLLAEGCSIAAYFSHCFNWEWAPSITLHSSLTHSNTVKFCQVYRPLRNTRFDAVMLKLRSRFGSVSLKKSELLRDLLRYRRDGIATITGFMSDQKPSHGDDGVPLMFLRRPTAFISGTATVACRLKMAVVYWDISKTSRGHYHIESRLITANASECNAADITRRYAALLEETIDRNPSIWLWTHKRWKIPVELPITETR